VPVATPVTIPEVPIVATAGVPLLHVQPGVALVRVVVAPGHIADVPPPIAAGVAPTVTCAVLEQLPTV
jgi:hypothetical protein